MTDATKKTTSRSDLDKEPKSITVATGRRGTKGVWVHYRKADEIVMVQSLHADQLDAATAALDAEVTGKIAFVPWDAQIATVIS